MRCSLCCMHALCKAGQTTLLIGQLPTWVVRMEAPALRVSGALPELVDRMPLHTPCLSPPSWSLV